ncbi:hypothetical protein [Pantoea eucrina]|uniref:hypothetical protein n=1 Tax=Pantoea eucrina TaxID=472693 RepID=UPI000A249C41|nr:hypothetical protein [Pantoea eucrina]ORM76480.1 hypothetical protein HA43_14720 [Pantoea eucrina]
MFIDASSLDEVKQRAEILSSCSALELLKAIEDFEGHDAMKDFFFNHLQHIYDLVVDALSSNYINELFEGCSEYLKNIGKKIISIVEQHIIRNNIPIKVSTGTGKPKRL